MLTYFVNIHLLRQYFKIWKRKAKQHVSKSISYHSLKQDDRLAVLKNHALGTLWNVVETWKARQGHIS